MKVNKAWIFSDIIEKNKIVFEVPVYQKNYDWSSIKCEKLFGDIIKANEKNCQHFVGMVVYINDTKCRSEFNEIFLIDGQQRITTIYILLKALYDMSKCISEHVRSKVEEVMFNRCCNEEYKIKLKLVKTDDEQLMYLVKDQIDKIDKNSNIYKNYNTFINLINKSLKKGLELNDILNGIKKLEIVEVILDPLQGDKPQKIFETINSAGLSLNSVDLIKRYLFTNELKPNELYEKYWLEIEKNVGYRKLEDFIINFLNSKISKPVNSKNAYDVFKDYCEENNLTHKDILEELLNNSIKN